MDWHALKILILDRDAAFAQWATGVLSGGRRATVRSTDSAVTALHMLREFPADIGLVDLALPEASAFDFLRWLRNPEHSPNQALPVVLTAVRADGHLLRQACEIGIESFMKKPIDEDRFLRRLTVTLASPSRFVIGKDYFGPDRRKADLPFEGTDRRLAAAQGRATQARAVVAPSPAAPRRPAARGAVLPAAPRPSGASGKVETAAAPAPRPKVRAVEDEPVAPAAPKPAGIETAPDAPARKPATVEAAAKPAAAAPKPVEAAAPKPKPAVVAKPAPKADFGAPDAKEVKQAERELAIDLAPILADHLAWLRSAGRQGRRAALAKADLHGADLAGANLSDADLSHADLSDARCREAVFQGADMRYANLSSIDATLSNLGVARLRHANMSRARLSGASLRGTDLAGATLRGADLSEADLSGCNLLSTDLRETDLSGVRGLTQAQLSKARADSSTRLPSGLRLPRAEA